ncbi:hypothetical protein QQZ08_011184 [Neonectria magnoliae]|uniref:Uncharacterized protein n=1 Tax=Neonectria magnoliae TaxID=2732573 RepID=A0ABR1HBU8_9HYPO
MACGWYSDPKVYEYLSSDTFWLLGIAIAVNAWRTNRQNDLFVERNGPDGPKVKSRLKESNKPESETNKTKTKTKEAPGTSNESSLSKSTTTEIPFNDDCSLFLQPHITTELRKFLAVIACSLVFPLQLLEGVWVLITTWRLTVATLKATYPQMKPRLFGFILHLPITAIILIAWVVVLSAGAFLVCSQMLYLIKLWEYKPGTYVPPNSDKRKSSDGEWDKVEEVAKDGENDQDIKEDVRKTE